MIETNQNGSLGEALALPKRQNPIVEAAKDKRGIGWHLKFVSDELLDCGKQLRHLLEQPQRIPNPKQPRILDILTKLLAEIAHETSRIAVIGQIKAGKSCFANAFARCPALLPTDINPWTCVVTHLHLGHPSGKTNGADFHFFTEAEWHQIAEGGGLLRELTEKLVPGYDNARLRAQVGAMKARVQLRLGPQFDQLLGKSHRFDDATSELLEKYVCAVPALETNGSKRQVSIYSDITRTADIFLPKGNFSFPTTLIDTPGVNDPTLVRDEITRQFLETADLHIVVLSAHQALTMADLALMRILQGLHKDRIIIFINRLDQLNNIIQDSHAIVANVSSIIRREFPELSIPIVAGSAWWGECALKQNPAELEALVSPQLISYAHHLGAAQAEDFSRWQHDPVGSLPEIAEAVYACSGLGKLDTVVSEMMLMGPRGLHMRQIINVLQMVAAYIETMMGAELNLRTHIESGTGQHSAIVREELDRVRIKVGALRGLALAVDALAETVRREMMIVGENSGTDLRDGLRRAVTKFAEVEADRLHQAMAARGTDKTWRSESLPLRRELEDTLLNVYGATRTRVLEIQKLAVAELRRTAAHAGLASDITVSDGPISAFDPPPPIGALGKTVVLDLGQPWWRLWARTSQGAEEKAMRLNDLIREEFFPIVESLVRSARADFEDHLSQALNEFLALCVDVVRSLQNDYAELTQTYGPMLAAKEAAPPGPAAAPEPDQGAQFAAIQDRVSRCRRVAARLRSIADCFPKEPSS